MPTVRDNLQVWGNEASWTLRGDEWSERWGGTSWEWYVSLLPRIHRYVPTGTILEIAPGYGRWTQYLHALCERLLLVDLAENCIEHCRQRFADRSHIEYHVNDGRSLAMIANHSIDFAFSFDSLVHVERDVMEAYLDQLATKLKPSGVAFLHHSNAGQYEWLLRMTRKLPDRVRARAVGGGYLPAEKGRAESMTAELFKSFCDRSGLACASQELIPWGPRRYLIDCLSVVAPTGSPWAKEYTVFRNPGFTREQRRSREWSQVYGSGFPRLP